MTFCEKAWLSELVNVTMVTPILYDNFHRITQLRGLIWEGGSYVRGHSPPIAIRHPLKFATQVPEGLKFPGVESLDPVYSLQHITI